MTPPTTLKKSLFQASTLAAAIALLSACGAETSLNSQPAQEASQTQATGSTAKRVLIVKDDSSATGHPAKTENITITSADGTAVAMTVFYPSLDSGEAAPLLMHSHGFGGNRVSSLEFEESMQTSEIGIDTLQVAYNEKDSVPGRTGWYVISYDQAGHGDSGGNVNIMDPEVEGLMYKAVLDWAEDNLSNLAFERKGADIDPVVGSIGRSYGGAFQLMGAGIDERLDAMVPNGTWFDLRYSLNPMGVPKTTYLNGLVLSGLESIQGRFSPELYDALVRASTTNEVPEEIVQRLGSNGAVEYCTDEDFGQFNRDTQLRPVPSLFIQGARDILFNINESIRGFECYNAVNPAAKLMTVKYGHSLDSLGMQESPSDTLANTGAKYAFNESKIWLASTQKDCPASYFDATTSRCVLDLKNIMFQFLAEHLLGTSVALKSDYLGFDPIEIPKITAVMENGQPDPTAIAVNESDLKQVGTLSDSTEPTAMFEQATGATGLFSGLTSTELAALAQPVYKSLSNGDQPGCYVGTPQAKVTLAAGAIPQESPEPPIVFVGLGITRADGSQEVLHEQITPVKGYGTYDLELPGISVDLLEGEQLTFVVQGYNPVFANAFNKIPAPVAVSAQVALPQTVTDASGLCK